MYEQFFELNERPFDLTPNPKFLVLTDSHREVLRNLEYGIASRKGLTVLIGEAGSGKTTMIRSAIARQSGQVHCVHMHNPTLSRAEFVETLAYEFGLTAEARTSKAAMLRDRGALGVGHCSEPRRWAGRIDFADDAANLVQAGLDQRFHIERCATCEQFVE